MAVRLAAEATGRILGHVKPRGTDAARYTLEWSQMQRAALGAAEEEDAAAAKSGTPKQQRALQRRLSRLSHVSALDAQTARRPNSVIGANHVSRKRLLDADLAVDTLDGRTRTDTGPMTATRADRDGAETGNPVFGSGSRPLARPATASGPIRSTPIAVR